MEGQTNWFLALVAGLGGVTGISGALWALYEKFKKAKQEDEKTAVGYYRGIIDLMTTQYAAELQRMRNERDQDRRERDRERADDREQLRLYDKQMDDAQRAVELLKVQCQEYEIDKEILWTIIDRQHEQAMDEYECCCRTQQILREIGKDPGPQPKRPLDPPPRPVRRSGTKDAADRAVREAAQGALLLKESNSGHKKPESPNDPNNPGDAEKPK